MVDKKKKKQQKKKQDIHINMLEPDSTIPKKPREYREGETNPLAPFQDWRLRDPEYKKQKRKENREKAKLRKADIRQWYKSRTRDWKAIGFGTEPAKWAALEGLDVDNADERIQAIVEARKDHLQTWIDIFEVEHKDWTSKKVRKEAVKKCNEALKSQIYNFKKEGWDVFYEVSPK